MISAFVNTWKIPELRQRIIFTLALIVIIRLGVHITLPGVDAAALKLWLTDLQKNAATGGAAGTVSSLLQVFSGGGLQQAGIFALGIMPYISASIMVQLLTAIVPKFSKLAREDGGRQKINQWTRYITIGIALVQGFFVTKSLQNPASMPFMSGVEKFCRNGSLALDPSFTWICMTVLTIVAGTVLLLWIADQITERGIGNGSSIIITVNIVAGIPGAMMTAWGTMTEKGAVGGVFMVILIAMTLLVVAGTIAITQAQRKIAVQYAKRVVGRKQFGGQTQYLPLKVNYSGVMPVIFATAVLSIIPMTLGMIPKVATIPWVAYCIGELNGGTIYYVFGGTGIFLFSYFWVAMMFQPSEIAEGLKRNGGYIPGIRPGKPTADFLDFTMTRLTFAGAIFLTSLFALPLLLSKIVGLQVNSPIIHIFGGTSLLIMVGVVLDVMRQVETQLLQKHYDGFLRKGKLKGRYDRLAPTGAAASNTVIVYLMVVIAVIVFTALCIYAYQKMMG